MLLYSGTPADLHGLPPSPGRRASRGLPVADRGAADDRWRSHDPPTRALPMSARTVSVDRNRGGSWEITLPAKHDPISYGTLEEARLEAYRLAAHWHPCEIVMLDAYNRVVHRKSIGCREDAAVYPDYFLADLEQCA